MQSAVVFEPFKIVPLDKFLPELQFEFVDLPEPVYKFALIRTARLMAREGNLVRRKVVIRTQPCVTRYALRSPDGLEVCSILGIRGRHCGCEREVVRSFDPPEGCCSCGRDRAWYDDQEQVLNFKHPYFPGEYFVTVAVCPNDDACGLPEIFYTELIDTLMSGTKARIMRMGNKPWTNLQLADAYEKDFHDSIADSAVEAATHCMRGGIRMNFGRAL